MSASVEHCDLIFPHEEEERGEGMEVCGKIKMRSKRKMPDEER